MNKEKWNNLSYAAQVSNIGSKISKAIRCKKAGKKVRGNFGFLLKLYWWKSNVTMSHMVKLVESFE